MNRASVTDVCSVCSTVLFSQAVGIDPGRFERSGCIESLTADLHTDLGYSAIYNVADNAGGVII